MDFAGRLTSSEPTCCDQSEGEPHCGDSLATQVQPAGQKVGGLQCEVSALQNPVDCMSVHSAKYEIRTMILDTGCNTQLLQSSVNKFLQNGRDSTVSVRGFNGIQRIPGDMHGRVHIYALSQTPGIAGAPLSYTVDTIPGLNHDLFSLTDFYDVEKFDVQLKHSGFSGLCKTDADGTETRIPVHYDEIGHRWLLHYVIATTRNDAIRAGQRLECQLQRRTSANHTCAMAATVDDDVSTLFDIMCALDCDICIRSGDYELAVSHEHCKKCGGGSQRAVFAAPATKDTVKSDGYVDALQDFNGTDANINGAKAGLPSREKKLTEYELHVRSGHAGYLPSCEICKLAKKSLRRTETKVEPYHETRPGYLWVLDSITWSRKSRHGSRYTVVMRDVATGYFVTFHLWQRSDLTEELRSVIQKHRADPRFQYETYKVMSEINLDLAGEQSDVNREFQGMVSEEGVVVGYSSPHDKRSAAHAENAVKIIEMRTKCIMMDKMVPVEYWEECVNAATFITNVVARTRDIVSTDGDTVRPMERITLGRVSRRQCDRRIHHFIAPGTLCLVPTPKVIGSDIDKPARQRWGVAIGTCPHDLPIFECPFEGTTFRSKDYRIIDVPRGQSWFEYIGPPCKAPPLPKVSMPHSAEHEDPTKYIVSLDEFGHTGQHFDISEWTVPRDPESGKKHVTVVDSVGNLHVPGPGGELQPTGDALKRLADAEIIKQIDQPDEKPERDTDLLDYLPESFIGKSVFKKFGSHGVFHGVITSCCDDKDKPGAKIWHVEYDDGDSEDFSRDDMIKFCIACVHGRDISKSDTQDKVTSTHGGDAASHETRLFFCRDNMTFFDVCDAVGVKPTEQHVYYDWLTLNHECGHRHKGKPGYFRDPFALKKKGKSPDKFKLGTPFPVPTGDTWMAMQRHHNTVSNDANAEYVNAKLAEAEFVMKVDEIAVDTMHRRMTEDPDTILDSLLAELIIDGCELSDLHGIIAYASTDALATSKATAGSKGQETDSVTGKIIPPKSLKQALQRSDADAWLKALKIELDGLDEMGVISHNHRISDLRKAGVNQTPVPMKLLFDCKYHPDGTLDKLKVRNVVSGTKHHMKVGEHFWESFSASPNIATTRLLQAICVGRGWFRLAFDIRQAYIQADCPKEEQIPVRYPVGMRRYDSETGEELYGKLIKSLYGSPPAGRNWSKLRTTWTLETFNDHEWTVKKLRADPCLFDFRHNSSGRQSVLLVHTDDCDLIGESKADLTLIAQKFDERFGIKIVDEDYMLGVKRTVTTGADGVRSVELTQTDYVETLFKEFEHHFTSPKVPETPFPETMFLSLAHPDGTIRATEVSESKSVLKLGYQSLVGSLLWACRNCYPELGCGVNLLCRMMSRPTIEAWECGLHVLHYLYGQRHRGIRFRSDGNDVPICYYDSSARGDYADSKSQYGHVVMLFNGPMMWSSKKHTHVGLSSSHNEYMALKHACVDVVWLRQLLKELAFDEMVSSPTVVLGDNDQATRLSREDIVTPGNRYIRADYHFAKECVELGDVCSRRVSTAENISDVLTKPLSRQYISRLRPMLTGYGESLPAPPPAPRG